MPVGRVAVSTPEGGIVGLIKLDPAATTNVAK
jgi:hypothetical protein